MVSIVINRREEKVGPGSNGYCRSLLGCSRGRILKWVQLAVVRERLTRNSLGMFQIDISDRDFSIGTVTPEDTEDTSGQGGLTQSAAAGRDSLHAQSPIVDGV